MIGRLLNITANILCNRSINIPDFEGNLIGLSLDNKLFPNSGHYISMFGVGDISY